MVMTRLRVFGSEPHTPNQFFQGVLPGIPLSVFRVNSLLSVCRTQADARFIDLTTVLEAILIGRKHVSEIAYLNGNPWLAIF